MTDTSLIHSFNVLAGKIDEVANQLPLWKQKALQVKLDEAWEILEATERRAKERRG